MAERRARLVLTLTATLLTGAFGGAQQPATGGPTNQDPVVTVPAANKPDAPSRAKAQLGLEFSVVASKLRRWIIRTKTPHGFAVRTVAPGSLADQASIKPGTIILEVDGQPFREAGELEAVLGKAKPGQVIELLCSDRKKPRRLLDRNPWVQRKVELVLPKPSPPPEKAVKDTVDGKSPGKQPEPL